MLNFNSQFGVAEECSKHRAALFSGHIQVICLTQIILDDCPGAESKATSLK